MEARLIRYEAEQITDSAGQITVTATPDEWRKIIHAATYHARNDESEEMVRLLAEEGVYS